MTLSFLRSTDYLGDNFTRLTLRYLVLFEKAVDGDDQRAFNVLLDLFHGIE